MSIDDLRRRVADLPGLREMFAVDPTRARWATIDACGIHADFSRQLVDSGLVDAAISHAEALGLHDRIDAMFKGAHVNQTEGRAALHTASRARGSEMTEAREAAAAMETALELAEKVRSGAVTGSTGRPFTAVVNIGIGGSSLGPAMATRALRRFHDGPSTRFVSNIDPADLEAALADLDPATTLVCISSKTFTTLETMHNAERARRWIADACPRWQDHVVASTADPRAALAWGVDEERCLRFASWVGGRFSVSSAVGFPVACAVGAKRFADFLDGMHEMDTHFLHAPFRANLPVMHGLVWWLNASVRNLSAVAVVPYSSDLALLPEHLQQLVMESLGKGVSETGAHLGIDSSPVVFGTPGTDAQHAYFQMLHQGTRVVPVDFIGTVEPNGSDRRAHDLLVANMLAQSDALATGRSLGETEAATGSADPHRSFPGNRPSTVLFLGRLDARHLGALVAMYEHSVFVQGSLMGVNPFDQFGVELGKQVAHAAAESIDEGRGSSLTMAHPLLEWYRTQKD